MYIDRLLVENFKGFKRREFLLHPKFNLVVGDNGTGKTSVLEALAIASASWFLGIRDYDTRHIYPHEVRLEGFSNGLHWEHQYPCVIEADGRVEGQHLSWRRTLESAKGRTTWAEARAVRELAAEVDAQIRSGAPIVLPLISYYGTGRLWRVPRKQAQLTDPEQAQDQAKPSRFEAYHNSVNPEISIAGLVAWVAHQSWAAFQNNGEQPPAFRAVLEALVQHIPGAKRVRFDAKLGELVVAFHDAPPQPFNNLSDGLRTMLALVGDIARKAATLNPHLEGAILSETPGLVLIDELDLHLHPTWQRRVVEDLRTTFPQIQFVCTTHSPFLIQSLRSGAELIRLDGIALDQLDNKPLDVIAQGVQGIAEPHVSAHYADGKRAALAYLELLAQASGASHVEPEHRLAGFHGEVPKEATPPPAYASNPAYQAFLEFQRVLKQGE